MEGNNEEKVSPWRIPAQCHKIRKMKSQKRALQGRLFDCESPNKKARQALIRKASSSFGKSAIQPPPLEDSTCEDSTLMDLLGLRPLTEENTPASVLNFSLLLASPTKIKPPVTPFSSPLANGKNSLFAHHHLSPGSTVAIMSPLKAFPNMDCDDFGSPSKDQRRTLVPTRLPLSPSFSPKSKATGRGQKVSDLANGTNTNLDWHNALCLDWSLKSSMTIVASRPFGWTSNNLKTSEESSGISAFVRCIDIEPPDSSHPSCPSTGSSQLDTSLGAQFHQSSLYWQHPSLPGISVFPREVINTNSSSQKSANNKPLIRFDKNVVDSMHLEWVEAFRSAFQLLKVRQCPFFYVCMNSFTCLFCSAGTQGDEQTQIYVSPSTRLFRDSLGLEGINFSMPYSSADDKKNKSMNKSDSSMSFSSGKDESEGSGNEGSEVDAMDEPRKWLEEMGLSQEVKVIIPSRSKVNTEEDRSRSSLLLISGSDTLVFFNFLINSKTRIIANVGPFAGLPPTILSPIAFHGATLKTLKVHQRSIKQGSTLFHSIDMKGPILPHVLHMLTSLLNKTVKNYKIRIKTLQSTIPLNLYSNVNQIHGRVKPSAFDLQNLSDCGLKRSILEIFCRCDNCHTIKEELERRNGKYRWK